MTVTMSLEVESGISMEALSLVLSKAGAECSVDSEFVSGNFKRSNAYFVFNECHDFHEVVADGVSVNWSVGVRGAFHCPASTLVESSNDIKNFLIFLADMEDCRFVLSFQYETVYAIRDESGLRFLEEMVR